MIGNADGRAAQVTFNFMDVVPRHSIGFAFGRVGDGWLLAPTFNDNVYQAEVRYKWNIEKNYSLEARCCGITRISSRRTNAEQKREDIDYFLRTRSGSRTRAFLAGGRECQSTRRFKLILCNKPSKLFKQKAHDVSGGLSAVTVAH
jgi:hypothetical protein